MCFLTSALTHKGAYQSVCWALMAWGSAGRAEAQKADARLAQLDARVRAALDLPSEHRVSMMEVVGCPSTNVAHPHTIP